jgi:hypothetical protein
MVLDRAFWFFRVLRDRQFTPPHLTVHDIAHLPPTSERPKTGRGSKRHGRTSSPSTRSMANPRALWSRSRRCCPGTSRRCWTSRRRNLRNPRNRPPPDAAALYCDLARNTSTGLIEPYWAMIRSRRCQRRRRSGHQTGFADTGNITSDVYIPGYQGQALNVRDDWKGLR